MSLTAGFVGAGASPIFEGVALWNGVGWDQQMNNQQGTLLASAARTAAAASAIQTNYNARGVILFANITAVSGTSGIANFTLNGVDPISGASFVLAPTAGQTAKNAIGCYGFIFYPMTAPTVTPSMIGSAIGVLPRQWTVGVNMIDGTSCTYSLGYSYIV